MDSVCGESFQVVAAIVGQRGVVVDEAVVLLIGEKFDPIVQGLDFVVARRNSIRDDFVLAWNCSCGCLLRIVHFCGKARWRKSREHNVYPVFFGGFGHRCKIVFDQRQLNLRNVVDATKNHYDSRVKLNCVAIES